MATWDYCSRNPDDDQCKANCTASTGMPTTADGFSKARCNTLYANFCADEANQSKAICACSLPWSSYPGSEKVTATFPNWQEPLCWFGSCRATGYQKAPPGSLCPACLQNLDLKIANVDTATISAVTQSCTVSNTTNAAGGTATSSSTATPASATYTPGAGAFLQAHETVLVAAAAGLVLLCLVLATLL